MVHERNEAEVGTEPRCPPKGRDPFQVWVLGGCGHASHELLGSHAHREDSGDRSQHFEWVSLELDMSGAVGTLRELRLRPMIGIRI